MLAEKDWVNADIQELILNHEENLQGSGPNKKTKLSKVEQILSLVNVYDKKLITEGKTPSETIKELFTDELGNYDLKLLESFKTILKAEGLLDDDL